MTDLLTFELDNDKDQLFIHGDLTGLRRLAYILNHMADLAEILALTHGCKI